MYCVLHISRRLSKAVFNTSQYLVSVQRVNILSDLHQMIKLRQVSPYAKVQILTYLSISCLMNDFQEIFLN